MNVTNPIAPPIDEACGLSSLPPQYISPPQGLVDTANEERLIAPLREAAQTHDPLEILSRSAVAFFAMSHAAVLVPFLTSNLLTADPTKRIALEGLGNAQFAPALADLSVSGRASFAQFCQLAPRESSLLGKVMALVNGWPEATQDNVLAGVREALERAYRVARALRGQEQREP